MSLRTRRAASTSRAKSIALLLALILGLAAGGAENPTISVNLHASLPWSQEFVVSIAANWDSTVASLAVAWGSGLTVPTVSLESVLRDGPSSFSGRLDDLFGRPRFVAGLSFAGAGFTGRAQTALAESAGTWAVDAHELELALDAQDEVRADVHLRLDSHGLSLVAVGCGVGNALADASYRLEWDELRRLNTDFTVGVPALRLEWALSTRTTDQGRTTTAAWHPLPEPATTTASAEDGGALSSAGLLREAGRGLPVADATCPVCFANARADAADEAVDFGEVVTGATGLARETIECRYHVACYVRRVLTLPRAPFAVDYAPIGMGISGGSSRDIVLRFSPVSAGTFEDTMTIEYCWLVWIEPEEDLLLDGDLGSQEGRFVSVCRTVEIPMVGVGLAKPEARVSYTPESPICGHDVQFDGSASYDPNPEGTLTRYAWSFDDGTKSDGARPVHRFMTAGEHAATLVVYNNRGMPSDPRAVTVNVAIDFVEAAVVAGAVAAAGLATQTLALAPPLLAVAASGTAIAVASIIHEAGAVRFPIDQLVLRFPESWDTVDVEELLDRNIPGSRIIGHFSTLHAFLVQIPLAQGSEDEAAAQLDAARERLARVLPSGAKLARNYVGLFEGMNAMPRGPYDLELLDRDLRVAYDAVRCTEGWVRLHEARVRLKPTRVAVIDSGVAAMHEEFVIPLRGRSYVAGSDGEVQPWYEDEVGHGTQIGGIIGAENGAGNMNGFLSGSSGHYEMQAYRVAGDMFAVWDSTRLAVSNARDELAAWQKAAETSARRQSVVVNISLGWDLAPLSAEERVLARNSFRDVFEAYPDVLFVSSAGNGSEPDDLTSSVGVALARGDARHAPGGIVADNNLTVAATEPSGTALTLWSNYGSAVDIAAPGQDVYTTDGDGEYVWRVEGTSYAAAMVSGAAAVVRAIDPKLTPREVKEILTSSATRVVAPDGTLTPVLDFADAVDRALASRAERAARTFWWSAGAAAGALLLGLLVLRPF